MATQLCTAGTLYEAQLILDRLTEAGIAAEVRNENLVGMLGLLPQSATLPAIWIENDADFERGRAVVDEYEARRLQPSGAEITCPACGELNPGNFELCWKCRAELPEPERK